MTSTSATPLTLSRTERLALSDLLLEVGPDAPTLCTGWSTRDLAAHLVVREGRPDAAIGIMVPAMAGWTAKVQADAAKGEYADLVARVRKGAPRWNMMSIPSVDAQANVIEYYVHHEDVRRAAPEWAPRELDSAAVTELWSRLQKAGKFFARRSPVGVVLVPSDGPDAGTELRIKDGATSVTLRGPVGELVLALYGRVTAGLTVEGSEPDVEAFASYAR